MPFHLEIYFAAMLNQNRFRIVSRLPSLDVTTAYCLLCNNIDSAVGRQHQCTSAHVMNAVKLITHSQ